MRDSQIVREIKKERLSRHFDEVDKLTRLYPPELYAPLPFRATGDDSWPAVYRPKVEQNNAANHMLRKHIRSRAFWKHHSDWERELEAIRRGGERLLQVTAADYMNELIDEKPKIRPTLLFGRTAMEDAFKQSVGADVKDDYDLRRNGGVTLRTHLIEEASAQGDFEEVRIARRKLVQLLTSSPEMSEIISRWKAVYSHQESMAKILNDVLLAGDIIYPCRFCRSFFKD